MNSTPIRELVKKTRQIDPKKLGVESFVYVDISSVDKDTKRIVEPQTLLVGDAPSRARKEIKSNDVLVATVRPNLNGVAIVPQEYDNQIASTGFCVLRPETKHIDPNYLFYFTQTNYFISHLTELSTGAGYPAVSDDDILDTEIPFPPLTEQKRIASLLARADRLRHLRRTAHDLGESLLQSVFLEMFGDPVRNEKGWEKDYLQDYTTLISSGSTPLGGSNVYTSHGYRFIRSQNVLMNKFDFSDIAYIDEKIYNSMKRTFVKQNDVLLNITGASIGRVACYQDDIPANVNQHVCIIRCKPEELNPIYLSYLIGMNTFQEKIISEQSGATRQAFTFEQIGDFEIITPLLSKQEEFASVVARVESMRSRQAESERQVNGLFESLLSESFGG